MEKTAGGVGLGRRTKGSLGCVASSMPVTHLREDVAGQFDVGIWCLEEIWAEDVYMGVVGI